MDNEQLKTLPRASVDLIGLEVTNKDDDKNAVEQSIQAIDKYLSAFVFTKGKCPGCDHDFGGIFGNFRWGLAHGEGYCERCHWPARGVHYVKDDKEPLFTLRNFILAYHPENIDLEKWQKSYLDN